MPGKISLGPCLYRLFCGIGEAKFIFFVEAAQVIVQLVDVGGLEVGQAVDPELAQGLHPFDRHAGGGKFLVGDRFGLLFRLHLREEKDILERWRIGHDH